MHMLSDTEAVPLLYRCALCSLRKKIDETACLSLREKWNFTPTSSSFLLLKSSSTLNKILRYINSLHLPQKKKNNNWFAMGLKLQFVPRPTGLNNGLSSQATLCLCWQGCKADYDVNTVWPCFPSLTQSGFDTWQPSSPSFENKNERALQDMGQQINLVCSK